MTLARQSSKKGNCKLVPVSWRHPECDVPPAVGNGHSLAVTPAALEEQDLDAARVELAMVHSGDFRDSPECCLNSLPERRLPEAGDRQRQKGRLLLPLWTGET
jgi:hypothetical protein